MSFSLVRTYEHEHTAENPKAGQKRSQGIRGVRANQGKKQMKPSKAKKPRQQQLPTMCFDRERSRLSQSLKHLDQQQHFAILLGRPRDKQSEDMVVVRICSKYFPDQIQKSEKTLEYPSVVHTTIEPLNSGQFIFIMPPRAL